MLRRLAKEKLLAKLRNFLSILYEVSVLEFGSLFVNVLRQ